MTNIYGKANQTKQKKQKFGKPLNDTVKLKVDTVNDTVNYYRIIISYYRTISYKIAQLKSIQQDKPENFFQP